VSRALFREVGHGLLRSPPLRGPAAELLVCRLTLQQKEQPNTGGYLIPAWSPTLSRAASLPRHARREQAVGLTSSTHLGAVDWVPFSPCTSDLGLCLRPPTPWVTRSGETVVVSYCCFLEVLSLQLCRVTCGGHQSVTLLSDRHKADTERTGVGGARSKVRQLKQTS
jgi:hypothetical protein